MTQRSEQLREKEVQERRSRAHEMVVGLLKHHDQVKLVDADHPDDWSRSSFFRLGLPNDRELIFYLDVVGELDANGNLFGNGGWTEFTMHDIEILEIDKDPIGLSDRRLRDFIRLIGELLEGTEEPKPEPKPKPRQKTDKIRSKSLLYTGGSRVLSEANLIPFAD